MRCVPISPLVDSPQMKKLPARSQKAVLVRASRNPATADANGFRTGAGAGSISLEPYGASPRSAGRSRMNSATSGMIASASTVTVTAA